MTDGKLSGGKLSGRKLGAILRWIQPLFLIFAIAFLVYLLYSQWDELRAFAWRLHLTWFGVACAILLASWAAEIWIWRALLARLGGNLGMIQAMRIWFLSAIVRYIPGNIWQPLSLTYMAHRQGVRAETTMASAALYQAVTLLAALPIAAFYLIIEAEDKIRPILGDIPRALPVALALAPLALFVANPMWLMGLINWLLRKVRRAEIQATLNRGALFGIFLVAIGSWLMWGLAFATLTFSLGDYAAAEVAYLTIHLAIIYPVAYAIGFVSFITPSGFGVREGVLVLLLAPFMPTSVATVIALAMRLWTMAGELFMAGLALVGRGRAPLLPARQPSGLPVKVE